MPFSTFVNSIRGFCTGVIAVSAGLQRIRSGGTRTGATGSNGFLRLITIALTGILSWGARLQTLLIFTKILGGFTNGSSLSRGGTFDIFLGLFRGRIGGPDFSGPSSGTKIRTGGGFSMNIGVRWFDWVTTSAAVTGRSTGT
jgi:hypothetical protein